MQELKNIVKDDTVVVAKADLVELVEDTIFSEIVVPVMKYKVSDDVDDDEFDEDDIFDDEDKLFAEDEREDFFISYNKNTFNEKLKDLNKKEFQRVKGSASVINTMIQSFGVKINRNAYNLVRFINNTEKTKDI